MEILPSNTEKQPEQDLNKAEPISEDKQHHVNAKRGRALLRKIDLHLMIPLWIVFVFGFLDRINLGNVSVLGILQELQMTGTDMADALQIFFVPYIISDVPSNVLLKRFAPSTWISMLTFFWVLHACVKGLSTTHRYLGITVSGYATALFVPSIVNSLGYSDIESQAHSIPIWAVAAVVMMMDANNLSGNYKRAVGLAIQVGFGNIGGIIASNIFNRDDAPLHTLDEDVLNGLGDDDPRFRFSL
ncbi:hypothetical protein AFLA_012813 [Aspergillus flavus NRRL3357]|nr:hypothetical protein AFLA_012813 [Aspergillus flavus NRRL3357]